MVNQHVTLDVGVVADKDDSQSVLAADSRLAEVLASVGIAVRSDAVEDVVRLADGL